MKLADALHHDRVVLDRSAVDKVTALQELLRVAAATLDLTDTGPLLQRVLDREAICSTRQPGGGHPTRPLAGDRYARLPQRSGRAARIFHREEMRRLVLNAGSADDIIRAITDQDAKAARHASAQGVAARQVLQQFGQR